MNDFYLLTLLELKIKLLELEDDYSDYASEQYDKISNEIDRRVMYENRKAV